MCSGSLRPSSGLMICWKDSGYPTYGCIQLKFITVKGYKTTSAKDEGTWGGV